MEQVGNKLITTLEPSQQKFKRGDVLISKKCNIAIFDRMHDRDNFFYEIIGITFNRITYSDFRVFGNVDDFRHATTEEAQRLWDALAKEGKHWNPKTMEIKDIEKKLWRGEKGCVYFYFNYDFVVSATKEYNFNTDDICYNTGNYFRTREQAQRAAYKLKAALSEFWKEELK